MIQFVMVENGERYQFRGHHGPSRAFEFLNSLVFNAHCDDLIDQLSKSTDWANSDYANKLNESLKNGFTQSKLDNFVRLWNTNDEYAQDTIGNKNSLSTLSRIDKLVELEVSDISNLLFDDPNKLITVGALLDTQCKSCAIGRHCTKIEEGETEDTRIAYQIKNACDVLKVDYEFNDTKDVIYEKDLDGSLNRGKIITLNLGDLRDFILRRLISCRDQYKKLEVESKNAKNIFYNNQTNEFALNEWLRMETEKLALRFPRLSFIKISAEEEILLQEKLDQLRSK